MEREDRRSTGLVGLDLALEGGIPKGAVILVVGNPLNGLDLFARQFWQIEEEKSDGGTYLILDGDPLEGMIDVREKKLGQFGDLMQGERVVVDSLSTLILDHGLDAALDLIRQAQDYARREGANVLCTLYEGLHSPIEEIRLFRAADGYFELRQQIDGSEVQRKMGIFKMKGLDLPNQLVPYNITAEGLELSTTKRVV
ncbi:RAD55 family ATPase [Methanofollis fontis]|uniref:KaiC-like domain-containing protein n=1 Tax=Methanofollis fontis TaxID=2052832 RepID=A0A483CWU1_9EURY|nr:ATPase domain-containing protein [Methanofollis fontis]TAJ45720.1 hypothetical protein CUJ86_03130 [Methanofollis fontis]